MPFPSAPPKFAQTTDPNKQFTAGIGNTVLGDSIAAGMTPSRADVEFMRKMREVRISRGEDPNGARNARIARNERRKDMIKSVFGMGSKSKKDSEGIKGKEFDEETLVDTDSFMDAKYTK